MLFFSRGWQEPAGSSAPETSDRRCSPQVVSSGVAPDVPASVGIRKAEMSTAFRNMYQGHRYYTKIRDDSCCNHRDIGSNRSYLPGTTISKTITPGHRSFIGCSVAVFMRREIFVLGRCLGSKVNSGGNVPADKKPRIVHLRVIAAQTPRVFRRVLFRFGGSAEQKTVRCSTTFPGTWRPFGAPLPGRNCRPE